MNDIVDLETLLADLTAEERAETDRLSREMRLSTEASRLEMPFFQNLQASGITLIARMPDGRELPLTPTEPLPY